jgi:hypothetical protein
VTGRDKIAGLGDIDHQPGAIKSAAWRYQSPAWKDVSMEENIGSATGEQGPSGDGVATLAGDRPKAADGVIRAARIEWLYLAVALVGGMIGGAAANRLTVAAPALAAQVPATANSIPAGAGAVTAKSIAAQEITLVDAKGQTRAALQLNNDGLPVFRMYDAAGKNRIGVGFANNGLIGVDLADAKGTERILLSVNSDGLTAVRLFDGAARPRMLLGIDAEGEPALQFYDDDGKVMRELP